VINTVGPGGFEYYFVDEEFVVGREFGLASEKPVHLGEREPELFTFRRNVCVPGKAAIEMKSKVFDMVLLRYLHIIYMDRWARCASSSERHMDRLSFISFNSPIS
jgi:hypothetical protein